MEPFNEKLISLLTQLKELELELGEAKKSKDEAYSELAKLYNKEKRLLEQVKASTGQEQHLLATQYAEVVSRRHNLFMLQRSHESNIFAIERKIYKLEQSIGRL